VLDENSRVQANPNHAEKERGDNHSNRNFHFSLIPTMGNVNVNGYGLCSFELGFDMHP
jgi:hypothetical protein